MSQNVHSLPLRFLLFLLALTLIAAAFSFAAYRYGTAPPTDADVSPARLTVVLDAGHGGEDGGAVSAAGLYEKNLNLALAEKVRDILVAEGVTVVMTRETDILLYDRNVDYQGRKKALDLAARLAVGENTPDSIFVSLHANAYPKSQYRGLQVWYSPNNEGSRPLAEDIQNTVKEQLQPENDRAVKSATSSIYLLHHITRPAVLVECGFLSNPDEAALLATEAYQEQLARLIADAILKNI